MVGAVSDGVERGGGRQGRRPSGAVVGTRSLQFPLVMYITASTESCTCNSCFWTGKSDLKVQIIFNCFV